jgi:hypothetical protein
MERTQRISHSNKAKSSPYFPTCRECGGTGFRRIRGGVTPCSCRHQHPQPPNAPSPSPSPSPSPTPVAACSVPPGKAKNQRERMIAKLEEAGERGVTNVEFVAMRIFRYSSRLRENRQKLFDIETIHVRGGLYRYILHSKPSVPTPVPSFQPRPRADSTPSLFASVPGGR